MAKSIWDYQPRYKPRKNNPKKASPIRPGSRASDTKIKGRWAFACKAAECIHCGFEEHREPGPSKQIYCPMDNSHGRLVDDEETHYHYYGK